MVACTLALDLDRDTAYDFVPGTRMCWDTLWPRSLYRKKAEDFVEQDFVAFVTAEAYDLLTFGSWYLWCVRRDACIYVHSF